MSEISGNARPPVPAAVLDRLDGVPRLIALLLYGAGLRLGEALKLRVKDGPTP